VNPDREDVAREVVGYHRPREQGGQNHVLFRRETGRFMCATCVARKQATGRAGQEALQV
jgi:hypothetical protein